MESQSAHITPLPPDKAKIKKLWTVALILGVVTSIEFIVAFSMETSILKISLFVGMTIIKASYIVGEFMHLRYETKALFWSIVLPLVLIVWLIIALLYDGHYILSVRL